MAAAAGLPYVPVIFRRSTRNAATKAVQQIYRRIIPCANFASIAARPAWITGRYPANHRWIALLIEEETLALTNDVVKPGKRVMEAHHAVGL